MIMRAIGSALLVTLGALAASVAMAAESPLYKVSEGYKVDPETMKAQEIVNYPSSELFFGATAALQVGSEVWLGSVRGDRIARYPTR